MRKSVWSDSKKMPGFKRLDKDIKTDVLIIGGGLCGILCGWFMEKYGVDYVVVEGNKIGFGITKNTTAKITSQHGLIYSKIISQYGKEFAQMYLKANQDAVEEYERLCQSISCDFEKKDAYTYSLSDQDIIEKEVKAVNGLGFNAQFFEKLELPFKTKGAVRFQNQAQFNPFKFLAEISKGLNIYEDTFIRELVPGGAITDNGKIFAEKIIVATHFPFINKHGSYFMKLYQHRSYVSAYENAVDLNGMYVDEDIKGMSFRNYGNLLLVGGGGHRTGKQGEGWKKINLFAKRNYPNADLKFEWATQDCMSLDGIPYIGQYSKNTPNMFVATGFNKWGMTSSMVSAMILSDMVREKKNSLCEVFSPSRNMLKPKLLVNAFEAVGNLITPTTKRCPHLGCALKWNKAEHSWDCPCHGSRFEENGKLIENPSTKDAKL